MFAYLPVSLIVLRCVHPADNIGEEHILSSWAKGRPDLVGTPSLIVACACKDFAALLLCILDCL